MKICIAQTRAVKGDIAGNITNHKRWIKTAVAHKADAIFFPELSLTGYEPMLSSKLATNQHDERLNDFQEISDAENITIGVGLPNISELGIQISMVIFQPNNIQQTYSKQYLHADELPFFVKGQRQLIITVQNIKIAPAICYESLLPEHSEAVFRSGADIYVASVAKSSNGVAKAFKHYPTIAKKYAMSVLMANCIGSCDDFESAGNSSIWSKNGLLLGQLDGGNEGILILNTDTEEVMKFQI